MPQLADKVAVITGATSGIGLATAERFAAEGARLVICGRRAREGEAIAKNLGPNCMFVAADVTQEADIIRVIDAAVKKFGRLDCLFNNAGAPVVQGGIADIDVAGFDAAMALLVRSVMLGMKHAAAPMRAQKSGSIINNASVAGSRAGYSSSIIYGAAKAAVIQLTRAVAMELGEDNIRVNAISPGGIATGIFGKVAGLEPNAADGTAAAVAERFKSSQPIPRSGLPADIAGAALFLASDDSSFINGHDLVVDGGMIAGRLWTPQQQGLRDASVALRQAAKR
jgi:NAD(P)-dependent dehydrogenase (short-subunit alcohol dehydrogenase family)